MRTYEDAIRVLETFDEPMAQEYAALLRSRMAHTSKPLDTSQLKKGDKITHPVYGDGELVSDPEQVESHQWSGAAAWCIFYRPLTAISSCWPYAIPITDLAGGINNG